MKAAQKHYKFINSKTGYVIYHYTIKNSLNEADIKAELEKVKAEVATKNSIFLNTIYWEEEKE
ncbi:hypothetical protein [Mucilaginibacter sp. UR6-11]|uniref:hypothetical protein n=1 Tax=Mucilaginibacter sp. UR6-11 TaxID=1435644 RepID=UPI001E325619|nr:hypothetical protein [Mucilaginibacter sp. UR6-11]MCC8425627.1 hypothetical protein [Mucilaginibacter sp. UR6-11]